MSAAGPVEPVPEGLYLLRNIGSGLVLEVYGGAKGSGAKVQQGAETGAASQHWRIAPVHEGASLYHVVNAHSGKRLDVANADTENGARIQQWKANNFGAQEWLVERHLDPAAPGTVTLTAFISGLALEVDEAGDARQWEDTDSPAQWWRLEPVKE
ncbi:RICIN domain-containing protein [Streptomyces sp. NPDC050504]|uniref:RICIN domain-containing protein n=1 Tax=Streptomyces sp. NPDC050504 TaxID=3365618 RepID=UPI00379073A5